MRSPIRRGLVAASALVLAASLAACASGDPGGGSDGTPADLPTGTSGAADFDDFALVAGDGDTVVQVWSDPRCPFCRQFEEEAGTGIAGLVDDGTITYRFHPMTFLDRASNGTEYSSRAASALTCVAVEQPDLLLDGIAAIFENQPEEGTDGLSNDEITAVLEDAGIDGVGDCVADETYVAWAQASNEAALTGIEGADIEAIEQTPTLVVDGVSYQSGAIEGDAILEFIESGGQG